MRIKLFEKYKRLRNIKHLSFQKRFQYPQLLLNVCSTGGYCEIGCKNLVTKRDYTYELSNLREEEEVKVMNYLESKGINYVEWRTWRNYILTLNK